MSLQVVPAPSRALQHVRGPRGRKPHSHGGRSSGIHVAYPLTRTFISSCLLHVRYTGGFMQAEYIAQALANSSDDGSGCDYVFERKFFAPPDIGTSLEGEIVLPPGE